MAYPGGKGGAGVFQRLINFIPPHRVYIEPFLGGGAVLRAKRPAALSIGIDRNVAVVDSWRGEVAELRAGWHRRSLGVAMQAIGRIDGSGGARGVLEVASAAAGRCGARESAGGGLLDLASTAAAGLPAVSPVPAVVPGPGAIVLPDDVRFA